MSVKLINPLWKPEVGANTAKATAFSWDKKKSCAVETLLTPLTTNLHLPSPYHIPQLRFFIVSNQVQIKTYWGVFTR